MDQEVYSKLLSTILHDAFLLEKASNWIDKYNFLQHHEKDWSSTQKWSHLKNVPPVSNAISSSSSSNDGSSSSSSSNEGSAISNDSSATSNGGSSVVNEDISIPTLQYHYTILGLESSGKSTLLQKLIGLQLAKVSLGVGSTCPIYYHCGLDLNVLLRIIPNDSKSLKVVILIHSPPK